MGSYKSVIMWQPCPQQSKTGSMTRGAGRDFIKVSVPGADAFQREHDSIIFPIRVIQNVTEKILPIISGSPPGLIARLNEPRVKNFRPAPADKATPGTRLGRISTFGRGLLRALVLPGPGGQSHAELCASCHNRLTETASKGSVAAGISRRFLRSGGWRLFRKH